MLKINQKKHREELEDKYSGKLSENKMLNRKLVSYQANKQIPYFRWFKYKEGFSGPMVDYFLKNIPLDSGKLLDPFAGSGVALFESVRLGWDSVGIELMPVGRYIFETRKAAGSVDIDRLSGAIEKIKSIDFSKIKENIISFRHIKITWGAFPEKTENELNGYLNYCNNCIEDPDVRQLLMFSVFSVMEDISFTRKDGQYLRWDYRANRNKIRSKFSKGKILNFKEAILTKLTEMKNDITSYAGQITMFEDKKEMDFDRINFRQGSSLYILPEMPDKSIDVVITSPPYCNRYDYTRTYALELAFFGLGEEDVKKLRQDMLSCTVENREKTEQLKKFYDSIGKSDIYKKVLNSFNSIQALHEVIDILERKRIRKELNNSNIVRMVYNYFLEMSFIIFEMSRILKSGGYVIMVNDNVRYAGEYIPVDLILSEIASQACLETKEIQVLSRGKGNSSQQMGNFGRKELRKCVYVWVKK